MGYTIHCSSQHLRFNSTKYVAVNCNLVQFCKNLFSLSLPVHSVCAIPEKLGPIYTEWTYKLGPIYTEWTYKLGPIYTEWTYKFVKKLLAS